MEDYRGNSDALESADQVEITKTLPYRLLHSADDSEGRQVSCLAWVGKIPSYTQLERPLSIRLWISLTQTGVGKLLPQFLDLRALLPTRKFRLELTPIFRRHG